MVDVKCKDKSGRLFIIEMQMLWIDDFMNRIVFNSSKLYVRQLDKIRVIISCGLCILLLYSTRITITKATSSTTTIIVYRRMSSLALSVNIMSKL